MGIPGLIALVQKTPSRRLLLHLPQLLLLAMLLVWARPESLRVHAC